MNHLEDFKIFLPKYLSPESSKHLFEELKSYPQNIDNRIYLSSIYKDTSVYQGDGINDLLIINLPDMTTKKGPAMIISNTCDIDPSNKRFFEANVCYCPIFNIEKYRNSLLKRKIDEEKVNNHIKTIKLQKVTQIFYLPKGNSLDYEAMVFFDKMISCSNSTIIREELANARLFTLSNYGFYIFLFKLSIHFTRFGESVDRENLEKNVIHRL